MTADAKTMANAGPAEPPIAAVPVTQIKPSKDDLEKQRNEEEVEDEDSNDLARVDTRGSHTHDLVHVETYGSQSDVYNKFPSHRKVIIVTILSFASFLAPMSSTTVLAAVPQVADTYKTCLLYTSPSPRD